MQAIILAAGKGTRIQPLSSKKEKPMLQILGKPILKHNLDQLNGLVKEVFLVIRDNNKGRAIQEDIGLKYGSLKIKYIIQRRSLGTGRAAKLVLPFLKGNFLLLNGDDFYARKDIKEALKKFPSILVEKVNNPNSFGVAEQKSGRLVSLVEKPENPKNNLVNTGLYYLPKTIFNYPIKKSLRGEYEFTDYIKKFIEDNTLYLAKAKKWIPVSFPWNVLDINSALLSEMHKLREGKIEKGVKVLGKLIIKKGSLIKTGSRIKGPIFIGKKTLIGKNCFLTKFTSIGDNCLIGEKVKIKNSVIGNNVTINNLTIIEDSIISDNCNLGEKTTTINSRTDRKSIVSRIKGKLMDTEKKKLGTIMGEGTKIGERASILPGIKIWPGKRVSANQVVKKDIR